MPSRIHRSRLASGLAVLPLALAAALWGQDASASAFQLKENSVQGLGRAYAGDAAAPGDCSVVVNNPAAMLDLGDGRCVQADLNIINFSAKFRGGGADAFGAPLRGDTGGDGGVTKPVPASYFTWRMNEDWALGAGLSAPFGFETGFRDGWVGRYEALDSKLQSIALTFSAAYRVSDQFSLGASLIAQRTNADLTQAVDFGTILAGPTNGALLPQEADGFAGLKGDDWGLGFQLAALFKPTDRDRIGFNFHSQINHTLEGTARFYVPQNIQPLLGGAFVNTPGKADYDTPWFVNASWWHTFNDRFSAGVSASFTHWSSFKVLDPVYANPAQAPFARPQTFDWEDTWFFSVGGDYRLNDQWTLRAGIAYDNTPTIDATRTPRVPDGSRTWLAIGVGYQYTEALKFDAGFVHLWVDDGKVDHMTSTFSTLVGHFESSGNVLGMSAQYRF